MSIAAVSAKGQYAGDSGSWIVTRDGIAFARSLTFACLSKKSFCSIRWTVKHEEEVINVL